MVLLGCGDLTSEAASGSLEISVVVSGQGTDPDGFTVTLDQAQAVTLDAGGVARFDGLEPRQHAVELGGVAPNCGMTDGPARVVTVKAADTVSLRYELVCDATTGTLRVVTGTTGTDLDPNGYQLFVDEEPRLTLADTGVAVLAVGAGIHTGRLQGVTPNCSVADPASPRFNVLTGQVVDLTFLVSCTSASPAGAGHEIAFTGVRSGDTLAVEVINEDGTGRRRFTSDVTESHTSPAWSPDGSQLLFLDSDPELGPVVALAGADGSGVHRLVPPLQVGFLPVTWASDGKRLLTTDVVDFVCPQVLAIDTSGSGRQVALSDPGCTSFEFWDAAFPSPDGSQVALLAEPIDVNEPFAYLDLRDFATGHKLPFPCFLFANWVSWAADGVRLAVEATSDSAADPEESEIFLVDLSEGTCRQLTTGYGSNTHPSWSPDASWIAFASTRDGNSEIYLMHADGSNQQRLTTSPGPDSYPSWRP
jgi:TolB protein